MRNIITSKPVKCLIWVLLFQFVTPYLACGVAYAEEYMPKTVLFFPLDNNGAKSVPQVVAELSNAVRNGMNSDPRYRVVTYSERLPAIQRIVKLQPDVKAVLEGPYSADSTAISRAAAVGKLMAIDMVAVGSVDKYQVGQDGQVNITASIMMIDAATGKNLRTIAVSGKGIRPVGIQVPESAVVADAIKDTSRRIVLEITGNDQGLAYASQPSKKSGSSWLLYVLAALGIGMLIGKSGGSSGGGGDIPDPGVPQPPDLPGSIK
jgi:hypothetical protein